MKLKEIAKFASGAAAWESVVHAVLGVSGLLPLTFFGFTMTPELNSVQIVAPAIVSVLLAYYAWFRN